MSNSLALQELLFDQQLFLTRIANRFRQKSEVGLCYEREGLLKDWIKDPIGRELLLELYTLLCLEKDVEELLTSEEVFERILGRHLSE